MEVGPLGVFHLKRLWSRMMTTFGGWVYEEPSVDEWDFDKIVIHGLGLNLEETFQYLAQKRPSYSEFEQWVIQKNEGNLHKAQVDKINAAVGETTDKRNSQRAKQEIYDAEPVLSAEDLTFWEENGYLILHHAVPEENCQAAEQAIWESMGMDSSNPDTWYQNSQRHGIMVQFFNHPALETNRRSPRIHKAFAQLWGTADLWVTVDRVSFNPPERRNWHFPGPKLHWDTSLDQPIPFDVSGLLYLTDTLADQGAFTCVPGFHRRIADWLGSLPPGADPRKEDLEKLGAVAIPGKQGDLIIWHQALPHGSRPNYACRPRMVQYLSMYPTRRKLHFDSIDRKISDARFQR